MGGGSTLHASVFSACTLVLISLGAAGCESEPKQRTFVISAHQVPGCELDDTALSGTLNLRPVGDMPYSAPERLSLQAPADLDFPDATQALEASLHGAAGDYLGYAERGAGSFAISLWPRETVCRLDSAAPLSPSSGRALGYAANSRTVLIAGAAADVAPAESVALRRFDTGLARLSAARSDDAHALSEPRAYATVTSFGARLLIAGGENPLRAPGGLPAGSRSAEIFDVDSERPIGTLPLNVERSRHSAVVLPSGETLLVGGRGPSGTPLNALETVSPANQRASLAGLAALRFPRLSPRVLALDDGNWLVAGGSSADGLPLSAFEWLSSDAREHVADLVPAEVPARYDRAFAALPGGGALIVGGCALGEGAGCEDTCRRGCPPKMDGVEQYDAWWLDPSGQMHRIALDVAAPEPVLVGGADGHPHLSAGHMSDPRWLRFDPWRARFEAVSVPRVLPRASDNWTLLDAGALVWSSAHDDGGLFGLRFGYRNHYATDLDLVFGVPETEPVRPDPLVPDRPTRDRVRYNAAAEFLAFEDDSEATVYVAGTDYADVTVELWIEGAAPRLVLGTAEFGGAQCPWPEGAVSRYRLERRADVVTLSSGESRAPGCALATGRSRLGLRRDTTAFVVRQFRVDRTAP